MKFFTQTAIETQRDKCAAAIRGLRDCLANVRLESLVAKALRESLAYEEDRLLLLEAAICEAFEQAK
jgi:hypothetical protein